MAKPVLPEIDRERCDLCGDCLSACPHGALRLAGDSLVLDEEHCAYCGDCEEICPRGAITLSFEIIFSNFPARKEV